MLSKTGAKLMDFGLAKPLATAVRTLPAFTATMAMPGSPVTVAGAVVGTVQYMSPEQVQGQEADARSDIFAFGCLLYEMATGKHAFEGKSQLSVASAILEKEPKPMQSLQPLAPRELERLVSRCLRKDPGDRWQSASDLASELNWILEAGSQPGVALPTTIQPKHRERVAWGLAALALVAFAIVATIHFTGSAQAPRVVRSLISVEEGTFPILTGDFAGPPALSPDGKVLAFVAARDQGGSVLLWVRPLNVLHARALAGTEGATFPFWSADSRALGFFAGGKLKTVPVEGGTPSEVCDAPSGRGGTWNADGTIVFAPDFQSTLAQVSASGGTPRPVTVMDSSKYDSHRWPHFLPDGKHFLYLAVVHGNGHDINDGIYFASLDGKENRLVMRDFTNVAYAAGRLLFTRDSALMAQPFDPRKGTLQGEAERLAEDVLVDGTVWRAQFDASSNGVLAYASGGLMPWQPMWYDRSGKQLGAAGEKTSNLLSLRLSRDGTRLATEAGESNGDIWIYDRKRQVNTRVTFGPGSSSSPVWSPDGQWIAYVGVRGNNNLYRKAANGMGQEELLLQGNSTGRNPLDWSPDGKFLLFAVGDLTLKSQIWALPVTGDRKPVPVTQATYASLSAKFSPDGRWVAYSSDESGRPEVYVMPFGSGAGKWQISNAGGSQPLWRRDGRELFFWSAENTLMSAPITLKPTIVEVGAAHSLFRFNNPVGIVGVVSPYDVTADGQRFVLITTPQQTPRPITLVTNWTAELKH
jgi:Tol biopolymer transport system component